jgi:hypothetical protein
MNGLEVLFDDVVGPGWCILACEPDVLEVLTTSHRDSWKAIGGKIVAVTVSRTDGSLDYIATCSRSRLPISVEIFLLRTAGPYIGSKAERFATSKSCPLYPQ